ncbi:hypothetical protein AKO1_011289 [Acrasis kona]|uniref:Uncharacterized protein n=1 Tax=Acrasis kona TaxID=1008807 RepID=A0AAW2YXL8_9EUKA
MSQHQPTHKLQLYLRPPLYQPQSFLRPPQPPQLPLQQQMSPQQLFPQPQHPQPLQAHQLQPPLPPLQQQMSPQQLFPQPQTHQLQTRQPQASQPQTSQPQTHQPQLQTHQPQTRQPQTSQLQTSQLQTSQLQTLQPQTHQLQTPQPQTHQPQPQTHQPQLQTHQPQTHQPQTPQPQTHQLSQPPYLQPPRLQQLPQPLQGTTSPPATSVPSTTTPFTTTTVPSTTTVVSSPTPVPTNATCPEVDCNKKCIGGPFEVVVDSNTNCKQCKCTPPKCPALDCSITCPGANYMKVFIQETGCDECRCENKPKDKCPPPTNCRSECQGGVPVIRDNIFGCPECECNFSCPPADEKKCSAQCNGSKHRIIKGHSGCDECLCLPECTNPKGCDPNCKQCECAEFKDLKINLVNYVTKRNYVPYDVYYDAKCNANLELITNTTTTHVADQYLYVVVIKKYVSIYRRTLILLRNSLSKLVINKQISQQVFETSDLNARQKMAQLEQDVLRGTLTIADLQNRSKQVTELISSLGYNKHGPGVCLYMGGKRVCNLHPNYVQNEESSYLKVGVFSKTIYTKVNTYVSNLKRRDATTVQYVRHSSTFRKNHIKIHPEAKRLVWSRVLSKLLAEDKNVESNVRLELSKALLPQDNLNAYEKLTEQQIKVIKRVVLTKFKRTAVKKIREEMRSQVVKSFQQTHKPQIDKVYVYPTRITKEIIRLPAEENTL